MNVAEIFKSIQGEGINAGKPAIFLRLSGCNFRCKWCDTKYAWGKGEEMSVEEVLVRINKFKEESLKHLVITGGEPLLQIKDVQNLLKGLKDWNVEIETNGSISIDSRLYPKGTSCGARGNDRKRGGNDILINCTPKLKNSGVKSYELKIMPAENVYYKFVVSSDEDVLEVKKYILKWKIPASHVLLMALGSTKPQILKFESFIKGECKKNGFGYSPRMHIVKGVR